MSGGDAVFFLGVRCCTDVIVTLRVLAAYAAPGSLLQCFSGVLLDHCRQLTGRSGEDAEEEEDEEQEVDVVPSI